MEHLEEPTRLLLQDSLLQSEDSIHTRDGSVNIKGELTIKRETGTWKSCPFVLGTFFCERLAYYGIATNLITYLTTELHQGLVSAAKNVTTFQGTCYLTPLVGSFFADAYLGRYWTIAVFYGIYLIGTCILIISATIPALKPMECVSSVCPSATLAQSAVFFFGLFLIALGTGGIKPLTLVQFYQSLYWYGPKKMLGGDLDMEFLHCLLVISSALFKWKLEVPQDSCLLFELAVKNSSIEGSSRLEHSDGLRFLDKAAVISDAEKERAEVTSPWRLCTVTQVEELKILIRMFPIWASGIIFCAVYAQMSTLFVEQGKVMDTSIASLKIPAASLSTFDIIAVIIWVPIYDRGIVPIARNFTNKVRGFSELQRMGIGLFLSVICMSSAALVESKRLQMAKEIGLVDENVPVPISILWQIPQYFLLGAAEVFTFIGQHEFFYEQAPDTMRSFCSALALLTNSLGNYLSSLIVTIVDYITTEDGSCGWITDNLNESHLDYFFWLLAGLSFLNMLVYIVYARQYKQKKACHVSLP
ncbi:unnamed protein product [Vicia faba]|uniref:Uncharacterized protein n=1 Tax=Vicia faba TaxID=3906 RepID=A0AAV1B4S1_VICFA|nr:unnamed protein product [Vicia faba]